MNIAPFPFQITKWEEIEVTEYSGALLHKAFEGKVFLSC